MRKETTNTFNEGMMKDLTPLVTPNNVLTDALNATIITFNGNEFQLQNDMGNCKVERAHLSVGFIPIGMKEYGGIVYIASYNPETGEEEVGAFPSPERDFSTTDFANISPANFNDAQFVLNTGTPVNERTSVIKKLIEPELLQLSPGDMYVVVYTINPPGAGPTQIVNQATMDQYISKDITNRKLFKLKFYKISDDNNLSEIPSTDIKVIENQPNIEDEYVYFKENSKGTIAVGLETETLDIFEANVIDTSRKTVANKTVAIEAIGYSNSLADFKGIKVDLTSPENRTFYIDKGNINKKVSAILGDLVADTTVAMSITPYSAYSLFPKLKKDFQVELGKYASAGAGTNNIFRYRTDTNFVKVDFDFQFAGDNDNGIHLYVEFYDPWSNYSIVKTIDNPTYYGINSFIMELIDEPASTTFNADNIGGTPASALMVNTDTIYERTLLNSTNLIRRTAVLRKNHFYIVRISGVDVDLSTAPATYRHYDLYKALYTNNMFNSVYDLQNSVVEGSPNYVADFTDLDFNLDTVRYSAQANEVSNVSSIPTVSTQRDDLITDGKYYKISTSPLSTSPGYKSTKFFKTNKVNAVNLTLTGTDRIFGAFKNELVSVSMPTLGDSNSQQPLRPTITDANYDNDPLVPLNSYANWTLNQIAANNYQILTELSTNRSVYSNVNTRSIVGNSYAEVGMAMQFYHLPGADGPLTPNARAVLRYGKYGYTIRRPNGTTLDVPNAFNVDEGQMSLILNQEIINARPYTAAILVTSNERCWFYDPDPYHSCARGDPNGTAFWKPNTMAVRKADGQWRVTRTHDVATMADFFDRLKVASSVNRSLYAYFPSSDVHSNTQIQTTARFPSMTITTNFNPSSPGVKTYLSNIMFKAISDVPVEFNTTTINNYIASRLNNSSIINNKSTIRDGFIPYITNTRQSTDTVNVSEITINQSADNTVVSKMLAGDSQVNSDPSLIKGRYPHGYLFSEDPNYQQFVNIFGVYGVQDGVEITPTNVQIMVANGGGEWIGKFSKVDRCDWDTNAIDMIPNIAITKT